MNHLLTSCCRPLVVGLALRLLQTLQSVMGVIAAVLVFGSGAAFGQSFPDWSVDRTALPKVLQKIPVMLFAREPIVSHSCSMAFGEHGRLFVGMRPPYHKPTPETSGDSVVMVPNTDGDDVADESAKLFTDLGKLLVDPKASETAKAEGSKADGTNDDRQQFDSSNFSVEKQQDRLRISLGGKPVVDFVFRDEKILRPYFANARLPDGVQVTRNHPPINGVDAVDHDTMHPGIWLGMGDINGQDFWRNKATMEHVRFVTAPQTVDGRLTFATECRLKSSTGEPLCLLTNHFKLTARPTGWLLVWSAEFKADQREIVFGDQEEMGFGVRVATPFTEKNGGILRSSTGKRTAKDTWGQPAAWCDYSGTGPRSGGILLMASGKNFRESWWHNRDYGVFVSNPFGREAMKQGARSAIKVSQGEKLRITFGALVHDHREFDPQAEFKLFEQAQSLETLRPTSQ